MPPTPETNDIEPSSDITELYKEILKSNGIDDAIASVTSNSSGLQGENFASLTDYITIKFEDEAKKPLNLFVKKHTENPSHTQFLEEGQMFMKEVTFCMKYVPEAQELCKSMGAPELTSIYPKCYYGDDKLVVFENLVLDKGFILLDKIEQQDLDAAKLALSSLAKHHAIGHALIMNEGGPKPFFDKYPSLKHEAYIQNIFKIAVEPMLENGVATNISMLEASGIKGSAHFVEMLRSMKGTFYKLLLSSLNNEPGDFLVLSHGDYWNNNMMFKKDKDGKLIDLVAVDFQMIRYASPSVDLAYYFYTSVKGPVRRKHFRYLLEHYLGSLKITANSLGHPIDITMKELEDNFCKKFQLGYWFGSVLLNSDGYTILKEIDVNSIKMEEWADRMGELLEKYFKENPDKCEAATRKLMDVVGEYETLSKGVLPS